MTPRQIDALMEQSVRPCIGMAGGFVRIKPSPGEWWKVVGCFDTYEECAEFFRTKHQEVHGIESPFFDSHHKPNQKIVDALKNRSTR